MRDHKPIAVYHARYLAILLTRQDGRMERLLPALFSANLDLHPHQIDAALFASRSVYRDGVILADEEVLCKTVETGIVLPQAAIEGCHRLLVLCPTELLDHWREELTSKFMLPVVDLNGFLSGNTNDVEGGEAKVVFASYR